MKVALALQTCDRFECTVRTLETLARLNDLSEFVLLHGDDGSIDQWATQALVASYGFQTVVQHETRRGINATRTALVDVASHKKADWIFLLENDIESLRSFPWPLVTYAAKQPQVYTVRLFGRYKDVARTEACKTTHQWAGNTPVEWRPFRNAPEKSQVGRIHWTSQPSVTRTHVLKHILRGARPESLYTVRVKKNVVSHFGERTEGRVL